MFHKTIALTSRSRRKRDQPPAILREAFRHFTPKYRFMNGVLPATFESITKWRDTGEWVAFYVQAVKGPHGSYIEKYVWALRNGQFVEVRQFGVRDVSRRQFMG